MDSPRSAGSDQEDLDDGEVGNPIRKRAATEKKKRKKRATTPLADKDDSIYDSAEKPVSTFPAGKDLGPQLDAEPLYNQNNTIGARMETALKHKLASKGLEDMLNYHKKENKGSPSPSKTKKKSVKKKKVVEYEV